MSFWDHFAKIKMPKMPSQETVSSIPRTIKEDSQKVEANLINVKYFSRNGLFSRDVTATIRNDTEYPIAYTKIPDVMGIIMLSKGDTFNLTTKKREMFAVEGYTASLVFGDACPPALRDQAKSDYEHGVIGKNGYLMAVAVEDIPRINTVVEVETVDSKGTIAKELVDITAKVLGQMGTVKWMEGMTEAKVQGGAIIFIMGLLVGAVGFALISQFAKGG